MTGATLTLRSAAASVKIGKPHSVQILGNGMDNLGMATLSIKFDAKRFQPQSVEAGALLGSGADLTYVVEQDTLKISFRPKPDSPLRSEGELVKVKWTPLAEGRIDLTLIPAETLLLDRNQSTITWRGKPAQLSVIR